MPGHRPAPLHTAPPPGARPRRRRAARGTPRLLAWPPPLGLPPGLGDLTRGGLGRESQAGATALARGGAARPGETTQASASGGLGSARQAAACRAAEPRLGAGLPVRPDRRRAGPEAAQRRRRAHAGGAGYRGRQEHQRRRHGLNARGDRRPARDGAWVHPLRQRSRAHGQRAARLVPVLRHGQQLHRARCAVGEPVRGVVQRPAARRVPGRRAVRQPARGAGARGLADRVQHEAPA